MQVVTNVLYNIESVNIPFLDFSTLILGGY